jgi:hypothetical protein
MRPTFRYSEETKEHNTIAMCSSSIIVYVTYGEIKGPVFIVSRSHRYSSFIATKDYWAKDRAVRSGILSNYVLTTVMSASERDDAADLLLDSRPNFRT